MTMLPPPPIPVMAGLTTASANPVATAASIALPPARRISAPTSAESGCLAETIPVSPTASVFSIVQVERLMAPPPSPANVPSRHDAADGTGRRNAGRRRGAGGLARPADAGRGRRVLRRRGPGPRQLGAHD